ncbi:hypothetical protein D3C81_1930620 [compost metagenome]
MNAGTVQCLIYINIADADDIFLIEQQGFDFGAFARDDCLEPFRCKRRGQRLLSQLLKRRKQQILSLLEQMHGAELAHIRVPQLRAVGKMKNDMGMLVQRIILLIQTVTAFHPQV